MQVTCRKQICHLPSRFPSHFLIGGTSPPSFKPMFSHLPILGRILRHWCSSSRELLYLNFNYTDYLFRTLIQNDAQPTYFVLGPPSGIVILNAIIFFPYRAMTMIHLPFNYITLVLGQVLIPEPKYQRLAW